MKFKSPTLLASLALVSSITLLSACGGSSTTSNATPADTSGSAQVTALTKTETVVGSGVAVASGKVITVHYTGWLYDVKAAGFKRTKIDSSVDRGTPYTFLLGATPSQYVVGWDQGIVGMQVGGKRTLVIPSSLGFGATGAQNTVPPNAA